MSKLNAFAQNEKIRVTLQVERELVNYQNTFPWQASSTGGAGVCRADGWNIFFQQLDGDFDLDEGLARSVIASVQGSTRNAVSGSWMGQYLGGETSGQVGSIERFRSELDNAISGPGNIFGNTVALKQAANVHLKEMTADALRAAALQVESGAVQSVKINGYMTLYNANKSGKGRPRPRVRIRGLPMQVITPALSQGMRAAAMGMGASAVMRSTEMVKVQRLAGLAASSHWTGQAAFLNGKMGGGVLTFAPSAALDAYQSIERDMAGDLRFNRQKFMIASAKSQSGNLLGLAGGSLVGAGFAIAGLTATPVILIALFGGVLVQAVWGWSGGADWAGAAAERALKH